MDTKTNENVVNESKVMESKASRILEHILSIAIKPMPSNRYHQIDAIKSMPSNRCHQIDAIKSIHYESHYKETIYKK